MNHFVIMNDVYNRLEIASDHIGFRPIYLSSSRTFLFSVQSRYVVGEVIPIKVLKKGPLFKKLGQHKNITFCILFLKGIK